MRKIQVCWNSTRIIVMQAHVSAHAAAQTGLWHRAHGADGVPAGCARVCGASARRVPEDCPQGAADLRQACFQADPGPWVCRALKVCPQGCGQPGNLHPAASPRPWRAGCQRTARRAWQTCGRRALRQSRACGPARPMCRRRSSACSPCRGRRRRRRRPPQHPRRPPLPAQALAPRRSPSAARARHALLGSRLARPDILAQALQALRQESQQGVGGMPGAAAMLARLPRLRLQSAVCVSQTAF